MTRSVRWVNSDREVRFIADNRICGEIKRIAGSCLECADARSQRMTRWFPSLMIYSALINNS